ncbi:2-hydroxy-palmitic acid dioxygenase Mpo1-like protein [Abortiporus biennis]
MSLLSIRNQFTFYGAYHANAVNVGIHMTCVPLIVWSSYVMGSRLPTPSVFPNIHFKVNDYLMFDFNWPFLHAVAVFLYYFILEPIAAILYFPQLVLTVLTAIAFYHNLDDGFKIGLVVHVVCWLAQFIGHGVYEKRAPALLDNLIGALVLAPLFVHMELLFMLGYKPTLFKQLQNDIGVEITKVRKAEGDKKRAAAIKTE